MVRLSEVLKEMQEMRSEFLARTYWNCDYNAPKVFVWNSKEDKEREGVKPQVWTREKAQLYFLSLKDDLPDSLPSAWNACQSAVTRWRCAHRGVQPVVVSHEAIGEDADKTVYLCPVCGADLFSKGDNS